MSLHQTGFQEVLALADLLGGSPAHLLLVGVQPQALEDFGGSLRPCVKAQIAPAIALALEYLGGLGIAPVAPAEPAAAAGARSATDADHQPPPALDLGVYEAGRPPPERACRSGDTYVGSIERMRDWDDYLREFDALLAAAPSRAPGVGIPVTAEEASGVHPVGGCC